MANHLELLRLADRLDRLVEQFEACPAAIATKATERAAEEVAKAFSGSWLGYHARVYFSDFSQPPASEHFDPEYGLMPRPVGARQRTRSDWMEFSDDQVVKQIQQMANVESLDEATAQAKRDRKQIDQIISDASSIIHLASPDEFLAGLKSQIEEVKLPTRTELLNRMNRPGKTITHDTRAINEGTSAPPHAGVKADVWFIRVTYMQASDISLLIRKAASHMERLQLADNKSKRLGTNVFIGHGRSKEWRVLKDFISDRLKLPWDEFNRIPVAGISNTARLSEMLDSSCIAFLVMTGEDTTIDGELRARENVVHEAGLFQGRHGFERAIVLLEDGCGEFSNIHGLGQIRFPKGQISAAFEEIRLVLEREKIILEAT